MLGQKGNVLFYKSVEFMGSLKVGAYNIIDELASKTSTTNTFVKTIINNDVILTISTNKRIVGTSTANQFKFQIFDNQGKHFQTHGLM